MLPFNGGIFNDLLFCLYDSILFLDILLKSYLNFQRFLFFFKFHLTQGAWPGALSSELLELEVKGGDIYR